MLEGRLKNLLVDVRTFKVQPEETDNISSAHEAMRAVKGLALAIPSKTTDGSVVYRIFPPDIWRNRYYTYLLFMIRDSGLIFGLGDDPLLPTKHFPLDVKDMDALWETGGFPNLEKVCLAIKRYHPINVCHSFVDNVDKAVAKKTARLN